jgi:hypothetical protein
MRYSGKMKYLFILLVIVVDIFAEPSARLSKSKILKGEPLQLFVEFQGKSSVRNVQVVTTQNGVSAEYLGVEENISIVNGKVSQKKILKYRVITPKDGSLQTPEIKVVENGTEVMVPSIPFQVSKEKYVEQATEVDDLGGLFDQMFGYKRNRPTRRAEAINPKDVHAFFHLNRDKVYVGETVVGYYALYYKNVSRLFLERNEMKSVEFPYFTSELLTNVTIETSATDVYKGEVYNIQPYQREVYALTPLRKGKFEIGSAQFSLIDTIDAMLSQNSISAQPKTVRVLELPEPIPSNFSGEVGDYKLNIKSKQESIHLGEPFQIELIISGKGTGLLFKDPVSSFCQSQACKARFSLLGEKRDRRFVKLSEGKYGFASNVSFTYSFFPEQEGVFDLGEMEISYFNPEMENYQVSRAKFPSIVVKPARILADTDVEGSGGFYKVLLVCLLSMSAGFLVYRFLPDLKNGIQEFSRFQDKLPSYLKDRFGLVPPEIEDIESIVGKKTDALLKNYLIQKGYPPHLAEELTRWKRVKGNRNFLEIYKELKNQEKAEIVKLVRELLKEGEKH